MADYWNQAKYWAGQSPRMLGTATVRGLPTTASSNLVRLLESQARPRDLDLASSLPRTREIVVGRTVAADGRLQVIAPQQDLLGEDGHWFAPLEVYQLTGVELDVDSGLIFSRGWVVNESGVGWRWAMDSAFLSGAGFRIQKGPFVVESQPVAPLGNVVQIFHFLAETVPAVLRVLAVEPTVVFVTSQEPMPLARQVLSRLGVKYRVEPRGTVLRCASVTLCPGQPKDRMHPADVDLMRTTFAPEPASGPSRVYVSRRMTARPLQDEAALEEFLRGQGFEILLLENLTFEEQVAAFSAARIVVAPHGAGLTHLMFMQPQGRLIEIATGELWTPAYRRLAHQGEHRYELVLVDSVGTLEFGTGRGDQAIARLTPLLADIDLAE